MVISGEDLKTFLRANNITQSEAAQRLNVSRQTISTWCGAARLSDETLQIVKTVFGDMLNNVKPQSVDFTERLKDKERIIELQAQRIAYLEAELKKLTNH